MIYEALQDLFAFGFLTEITEFMHTVMETFRSLFSDQNVSTYLGMLTGAAGAVLIIYYFMDIMSNVQRDMVTIEKVVLSFIKLLFGFCILLYLQDIIVTGFQIADSVYTVTESYLTQDGVENSGLTYFGMNEFPEADTPLEDLTYDGNKKIDSDGANLAKYFDNGTKRWAKESKAADAFKADPTFETALSWRFNIRYNPAESILIFAIIIVLFLMQMAARGVIYLNVISNGIMLLAYALFAPFGVAQCFEEGTRSAGIRYIKKFLALALTFATILGILFATSKITSELATVLINNAGVTELNWDNIGTVLTRGEFLCCLLVSNFACVGGIAKAKQIAQDILGV